MKKENKNTTVLYCLAVMFTAWCTWNSVNNGGNIAKLNEYRNEVHLFQRQVASLIDKVDVLMQRDISVIVKEVKEPVEEVIKEIVQ
jgi:hypothetical protein